MNHVLAARDDAGSCGPGGGVTSNTSLRIASVFVILLGSIAGALFPVLAYQSPRVRPLLSQNVFDFAKFFGSGVIIATAFIHLLDPALDELSSPCLSPAWLEYPYALALVMMSIFTMFIVELVAFRWGTAKLASIGVEHDDIGPSPCCAAPTILIEPSIPKYGATLARPSSVTSPTPKTSSSQVVLPDCEQQSRGVMDSPATQIIGVAILEFGILLHSVLIGMTLAVSSDFVILFIVIVVHQLFEGMGVGSRLAYMKLPPGYTYVPIVGAILYGIMTPLGVAIGLGLRTSYNPDSATASIVSGILDSFSAGILIYTSMVQLLAREFLHCKDTMAWSNGRLTYAVSCTVVGSCLMAVLARWA
ncbi:ZIP-like iron-zinc transporter [Phanerochaete sordida]|uniref:ZIP-like iron-zinc transporter n=1 Tax=Phanerochaete sordida TaxID=48140 RepID=A0A9P3GBE0_9APHY|nr:ZIP-like iron-zinc transporter [Phanerochaete sordida]